MKIFVVGDIGWDHYFVGKVRGLSAEAPIPIVDVKEQAMLPGMAGNVFANLKALEANVELLAPRGETLPVKSRLISEDGQQLARFDINDYCQPYQRADLLPLIDADAVIVADYGKGAIDPTIAQILAGMSAPLFVDTKGDPSVWLPSNAFMFPNQLEYDKYCTKYEWFPRVVLKQGAEGLSYVEYGKVTTSRPAWARTVRSVNGAGDTVIAAFTFGYLLLGGSIQLSLDVANAAAACVVEQDFLSRTTTPEAVGKRIADEVPQEVYSGVQTRHRSTDHLAVGANLQQLQADQSDQYSGQLGRSGYNVSAECSPVVEDLPWI